MSDKIKFRSGFVTITGRPNVGKSTLMNLFIGDKVAIVSAKPQTTRNKITGILTRENFQIVFIDTPGIHAPRTKLGEFMMREADSAVKDVDCVIFMVAPPKHGKIDSADMEIIQKLKKRECPVILVINKIDTIAKPEVLEMIKLFAETEAFTDIVPTSAINAENTNELLAVVSKYLPEGPKYFPDDMITDQPERQIASEIIREKTLFYLQDEIPHGIAVEIESMKKREDKDLFDVEANIFCERDSHKAIIIGKGGETLKKVGAAARFDLQRLLGSPVYLRLWVKAKKNWRESDVMLRNFGYREQK